MDVDEEMGAEDLFADTGENENEDPPEAAGEPAEKKPEEPAKKRIVRNPQPKLDPDRICGLRGISVLSSDVFADFSPGGKDVFADLDRAMKRMEHWAHRLYPKLPFDDVMDRISVLGKKMAVQTNVKRIRMGIEPVIQRKVNDDDEEDKDATDETKRYDDEFPADEMFDQLARDVDEVMSRADGEEKQQPAKKVELTEEQRERIRRNRELAIQRRRERQEASFSQTNGEDLLPQQSEISSNIETSQAGEMLPQHGESSEISTRPGEVVPSKNGEEMSQINGKITQPGGELSQPDFVSPVKDKTEPGEKSSQAVDALSQNGDEVSQTSEHATKRNEDDVSQKNENLAPRGEELSQSNEEMPLHIEEEMSQ